MTDDGDDQDEARLRTAFAALREADANSTPPFDRTWAAARQHASGRSTTIAVAVVSAGVGAAVVAAAAAVLLVVVARWPSDEPGDGRALASAVAAMHDEPLGFLLAPPSASVLTAKAPFASANDVGGAW